MVKTIKPVVKNNTELKDIKEDMLKMMDKLDSLEQKITNVAHRVKRLETRVGIV
jgi:predicted  nucleic acid-binding Zn-ribbon protein